MLVPGARSYLFCASARRSQQSSGGKSCFLMRLIASATLLTEEPAAEKGEIYVGMVVVDHRRRWLNALANVLVCVCVFGLCGSELATR